MTDTFRLLLGTVFSLFRARRSLLLSVNRNNLEYPKC